MDERVRTLHRAWAEHPCADTQAAFLRALDKCHGPCALDVLRPSLKVVLLRAAIEDALDAVDFDAALRTAYRYYEYRTAHRL